LRLGGSLGIALGPVHGRTGAELMRHADIAMYAAKAAGGGWRTFSPELDETDAATLTLASDLRDALTRDEIDVAVQPIVELATGRVHSVEVLARWEHAHLGPVRPADLFAAAEQSGQVPALSGRILDRALALCADWHERGSPVRVAVNLAPRWLADGGLPEHVATALAARNLPADLLCLEITEPSVIADPRRAVATLVRLREMGVHLSVDDFGTGYSSLTYLSRLPVDQLKIDKSFVVRLDASARDLAVVRSIVDLGRNLGLEVVAEGVSNGGVGPLLLEMGCTLAQGYHFSRPISPDAVPAYLERSGVVARRRRTSGHLPPPPREPEAVERPAGRRRHRP
jgi:predicted signal transduction protein with EAL and GGDEF domain